jgi:methylated-DNA-[protein]-cysteine S-methyltransferase
MPASGFSLFQTPVGECAIAWSETAIVGVLLPEDDPADTAPSMQRRFPQAQRIEPPDWVQRVIERTQQLLEGASTDALADVPLDMEGVPEFNRRVYEIARAIAPGETLTYGEVAAKLGEPGAARAVGQALGHNPFAPIVPCHRVLAAGKRSGGFSAGGGVATKLKMLEIERAQLGDGPGLFD